VQRLSARRRYPRAGAVTVADLIKKHPAAVHVPPSSHSAVRGCALDELLDPPTRVDEVGPVAVEAPSRAGNIAKLVGLAASAFVLCGSVAAAAVITNNRPHGQLAGAAARPPLEIIGAGALRPDMLGAQLGGAPGAEGVPAGAGSEPPALPAAMPGEVSLIGDGPAKTEPADGGVVAAPRTSTSPAHGEPVPLADGGSGGSADRNSNTAVGVVREFYRLVGQEPDAASELLSPEMQGADPTGFVQSWASVLALRLERVELRPDRAVLAVVAIQGRDRRWMRVEQLLRLATTSPPRIVGAELLAAQVVR
jgi:hypothetical protein